MKNLIVHSALFGNSPATFHMKALKATWISDPNASSDGLAAYDVSIPC